MHALIKSVKAATSGKETLIKNSITTELSDSVKEIQLCNVGDNLSSSSGELSEAGSSLCTILEALFLHGLKDSLVHRARRAMADFDEKPQPSFWAPLLIISHRQIIDQITNLSQITSEIGQCRAWIRLALNDCLLSSYMSTLRQDSSSLKPYYNSYAYVRDGELLEVAQRLIEGVEAFTAFSLPCNSSLLNTWPLQSLLLAGIWAPTLRSCPVAAGVDVAQSLVATTSINSETCSIGSAISFTSHSSGIGQMLALNEDEALRIILAKHSSNNNSTKSSPLQLQLDDQRLSSSEPFDGEAKGVGLEAARLPAASNLGNSLSRKSGWSFSETRESEQEIIQEPVSPTATTPSIKIEGCKSTENSYNALIESYNMLEGSYVKTPIKEVWQKYEEKSSAERDSILNTIKNNKTSRDDLRALLSNQLSNTESLSMTAQVGKIAREQGLDAQNYECAGCKDPVGLTPKPKVCAFTGKYFCDNCMSSEAMPIPARIIHNWDFKPYFVSQKAYNYINEIKDHPTIDFKILNPSIYTMVDDMGRLQTLRIQLNFLRDYLYTCREPVIEQLQKQMWQQEYMYEHLHQYSVNDLSLIVDQTLAEQLLKVVKFGTDHVYTCWLCKQKGFLCEICKKAKILYPFDVDHVFRCNNCNSVYHNTCLNETKPCPKCKRKKKRENLPEDLPLLGATID